LKACQARKRPGIVGGAIGDEGLAEKRKILVVDGERIGMDRLVDLFQVESALNRGRSRLMIARILNENRIFMDIFGIYAEYRSTFKRSFEAPLS
jgi:hypothetical protein